MAETFGGFPRASRKEVRRLLEATVDAFFYESVTLLVEENDASLAQDKVMHPADARTVLRNLVANDRYWRDEEKGFLMRFPSSKLALRTKKPAPKLKTKSKPRKP